MGIDEKFEREYIEMMKFDDECELAALNEALRIEHMDKLLENIDICCPHCRCAPDLEWSGVQGEIAIVCACGAMTGECATPEEAVDQWCGIVRGKMHESPFTSKDAVIRQIEDRLESCSEVWMAHKASYDAVRECINMIWNNEIKGIRFSCGGAHYPERNDSEVE
jgi:hypothetical protein